MTQRRAGAAAKRPKGRLLRRKGRAYRNTILLAAGLPLASTSIAYADLPLTPTAPSYNFAGQVGLLDMPTARFQDDGEISMTVSSMHVLDRYSLGFQALPWLETTFRYSRLDRYLGNNTDLYDRSLGFKIRLSQEDDFWPSIAVGAQDILGTGAMGAEYLVASKQIGPVDATLGIGWRRFAGFAPFDNPIGAIFPSFKQSSTSVTTGVPLLDRFFHGPNAGLFGGLSWQTPISGLRMLVELSGDAYRTEQRKDAIDVRMPLNFGFSYEPWQGIQIGAGYMYGSVWGIRVSLHANPFDPEPKQRFGEQPTPLHVRTPEARRDAVLDMVQDRTNYYDNWYARKKNVLPGVENASLQNSYEVSISALVDHAYDDLGGAKLRITDAETYGDSVIFEVTGSRRPSCGSLSDLRAAAARANFKQIVLTTNSSVTVCDATDSMWPNASFASLASLDETDNPISPDSADTPAQTDALSSQDERGGTRSDKLKADIIQKANAQGIFIQSISVLDARIEVAYLNNRYRPEPEAVGRLLRILMAEAPNSIEEFRLVSLLGYVPTLSWTFQRSELERTYENNEGAASLFPLVGMQAVDQSDPLIAAHSELSFPRFGWGIGPGLHESFFDPNNPYNFAIYASLGGNVDLTPNLTLSGSVEANIYTTFTKDTRKSNSLLPHVRSDFVSYYQKGKNGIASLQASYFTKLSPDVYAVAHAGYLESMYAGIGGEVLWQPPHTRWALGGSLYAVQQRSFDRLFGLRDYRVITGHAALYYASPFYGLDFALYAGRYLAGDYGATFEIRRRFSNGIEIGAYATLTNVPFSTFGEGSFDKGFIIRIPLDFLAPINTQREINLDFTPLTRDGGQRLENEQTLYYALKRTSEREMLENWQDVIDP